MIEEEKVKLMTKMAVYEKEQGTEDFKISAYYKKDYSSLHTCYSLIFITVGYFSFLAVLLFGFMDQLLSHSNIGYYVIIGVLILVGYVVLLILSGILFRDFYEKKHTNARRRVKIFHRNLLQLQKMYGKGKA